MLIIRRFALYWCSIWYRSDKDSLRDASLRFIFLVLTIIIQLVVELDNDGEDKKKKS